MRRLRFAFGYGWRRVIGSNCPGERGLASSTLRLLYCYTKTTILRAIKALGVDLVKRCACQSRDTFGLQRAEKLCDQITTVVDATRREGRCVDVPMLCFVFCCLGPDRVHSLIGPA